MKADPTFFNLDSDAIWVLRASVPAIPLNLSQALALHPSSETSVDKWSIDAKA